jgi:hypothetical protein
MLLVGNGTNDRRTLLSMESALCSPRGLPLYLGPQDQASFAAGLNEEKAGRSRRHQQVENGEELPVIMVEKGQLASIDAFYCSSGTFITSSLSCCDEETTAGRSTCRQAKHLFGPNSPPKRPQRLHTSSHWTVSAMRVCFTRVS